MNYIIKIKKHSLGEADEIIDTFESNDVNEYRHALGEKHNECKKMVRGKGIRETYKMYLYIDGIYSSRTYLASGNKVTILASTNSHWDEVEFPRE